MEWTEVADIDALAAEHDGWDGIFVEVRPNKTEADWIANANPIGEMEISPLFWFKPMHGEMCPSKNCILCSTDATSVAQLAQVQRDNRMMELASYGVEWDPTITF